MLFLLNFHLYKSLLHKNQLNKIIIVSFKFVAVDLKM